jgi:hypothetical protein
MMTKNTKLVGLSIGLAATLSLGAAAAYASAEHPSKDNSPAVTSEVGSDHPECYDPAKLNDPNDFCFKTIGPWNSVRSSDDEVRALMPVKRMVKAGKTVEEIRRYYPEYSPQGK